MAVFESIFAIDSPHMVLAKNYHTADRPTYVPLNESVDKPRIMIDFDGVIHQWNSEDSFNPEPQNPIIEGVKEAIEILKNKYEIVIFTTRVSLGQHDNNLQEVENSKKYVSKYLFENEIYFDLITGDKLAAAAYIDDRAFRFQNWSKTLANLKSEKLI